jgi:hypothetical protein
LSKNPESGLSFSDHQPVAVKLTIHNSNLNNKESHIKSLSNSKNKLDAEINFVTENSILPNDMHMEGDALSVVTGNKKSLLGQNLVKVFGGGNGKSEDKSHVDINNVDLGIDGDRYGECNCKNELIDINCKRSEHIGLLSGKRKYKSNILLDVTEIGLKASKSGPLQLRHSPVNDAKSNLSFPNQSKIWFKTKLLDYTKNLLENYLKQNNTDMKSSLILFGFFLIFIYLVLFSIIMLTSITTINVLFSIIIITIITVICLALKFLAFHYEQNAVKAIINDITSEIYLSSL